MTEVKYTLQKKVQNQFGWWNKMAATKGKQVDNRSKGSVILLIALILIFWPGAILYAIFSKWD